MSRLPQVPLQQIVNTCEEIYNRDGYVRWAEVAAILGISRQAVQSRLKDAQTRGDLSPESVVRWQSMASRAHLYRNRRDLQELHRRLRLDIQLSSANYEWLDAECAASGTSRSDFVNGVLNKAREAAPIA